MALPTPPPPPAVTLDMIEVTTEREPTKKQKGDHKKSSNHRVPSWEPPQPQPPNAMFCSLLSLCLPTCVAEGANAISPATRWNDDNPGGQHVN